MDCVSAIGPFTPVGFTGVMRVTVPTLAALSKSAVQSPGGQPAQGIASTNKNSSFGMGSVSDALAQGNVTVDGKAKGLSQQQIIILGAVCGGILFLIVGTKSAT